MSWLQSIVAGLKSAPSNQVTNIFESCLCNPRENIMKLVRETLPTLYSINRWAARILHRLRCKQTGTCRNFVFAIYTSFVDYVYCKYLLKFSSFPSHSLNDVFDLQSFWVKSFIFTLWLVFFVKSLSITKSGRYPTPPQPRPGHCSSYEGRS